MGLLRRTWTWVKQRVGRLSRAGRLLNAWALPGFGAGAWNNWTDNRNEQVRRYRYWVFISINAIANKVAQLAPQVGIVRQAPEGVRGKGYEYRGLHAAARHKALTQLSPAEDLEPVPHTHPLLRLLRNPNEPDTAGDFVRELLIFLYLTGNAYVWLPEDGENGFGQPGEMWVLPSHWVWPLAGDDGLIDRYEIRPVYSSTTLFEVKASEVVHFKFKSPISKIDGWSHLSAGARWIDNSEAVDASRWHAFNNIAQFGPLLLLDSNVQDPSPEDLERIEQKFMSKFAGPTKAGRPIVLGGVREAKPYTTSPREMDFGASNDQLRDQILGLFGVPRQAAMFSEGTNYTSILAIMQWFCSFTINPLTHYLGEVFTEKIAPRFDASRRLRVYWDDATPEDPAQRLAENQAYVASGVKTLNEVRQELGLKPYEGIGDWPILPAGVAEFSGSDAGAADLGFGLNGLSAAGGGPAAGVGSDSPPLAPADRLSAAHGNGHVKVPEDW